MRKFPSWDKDKEIICQLVSQSYVPPYCAAQCKRDEKMGNFITEISQSVKTAKKGMMTVEELCFVWFLCLFALTSSQGFLFANYSAGVPVFTRPGWWIFSKVTDEADFVVENTEYTLPTMNSACSISIM